ncbi:MAG TPA: alpha/beta hydrolase [Mycobacteriales bacterium]|nr:alpha/beta hydrolase [Mycobacteriales bacterium]
MTGRPAARFAAFAGVLALLGAAVLAALDRAPDHRGGVSAPVRSSPPAAAATLRWTPCGTAQCSTLTVPLDWSGRDPKAAGHTVPIAVLRLPATGPRSQRIGSLLVNPGGPGESGVAFVRDHADVLPAEVRARFDIVGFDPRGVGLSMPVHCLTDTQLDAQDQLPPYPANPGEQRQLVRAAQTEALACAKALGPALGYLATADVARDLDALRAGLGEQRLSYLGYSYGTAIGAAYAQAYPTRIRALVLDGALDPAQTAVGMLRAQAGGFEAALSAFAGWCARNGQCSFGAHLANPAAVLAGYDRLAAAVRAVPLAVGARQLGSGEFTLGVLITLYSKEQGWPALGYALARAASGDGSVLLRLADAYVERDAAGHHSNLSEANLAVNCLDRPWPRQVQDYAALATELARTDPRFGRTIAWSGLGCLSWAAAPVTVPHPVRASSSPPILVVGTTRDPATPYAQARSLAGQLDHGVLLTVDGDGHTAYRATGNPCVVKTVDAYLLDLNAPSRAVGARC